jgi:hypothetical protein
MIRLLHEINEYVNVDWVVKPRDSSWPVAGGTEAIGDYARMITIDCAAALADHEIAHERARVLVGNLGK